MLQNIKAVIFDLDGTLVDSMGIWKEIDIEYLGRFGHTLPDTLQSEIEGMCFTETAEYIKKRFDLPDSIEKMKNDWNEMAIQKYTCEVPLKPGVLEFLKLLKQKGIKMGIATSNSRELAEAVANRFSFPEYITCLLTGCDVKKGKPAPDVYLTVAQRLGVEPEECLVFEDIVAGIMAGKNAGMKVCAVEDAYSVASRAQKKELADYYIQDYYELVKR